MEQEMKYIYTVYKHASFSKAASALFMTQPALSLAVQRVEAKVGMPLFDRTCKPLKLTAAGGAVHPEIRGDRKPGKRAGATDQ